MEVEGARRARWPWVLLIIVLVVAVLAVAAELIARAVLPGIVRGIVIEQLELPADQQLDVDASGILLPQLIGGRLDRLDLTTESVTIGGVTGAADVTATGIPLRGGDLTDARGTVRIDSDQFTVLVAASDLPIDSVAFAEPDVTVSGSVPVLGLSLPIALTVTPGADAGELLLTPVSLQVAGATLDAQQIADRFGTIAEQLTETQRICIADQLPAGLTMTGLAVDGDEVVVDVQVDGAIVTDETLQENGVCP
ncbi:MULTISPECIES: LmeA family phospholipid-binding protein [Microbacterium]|uniref:LmeA family phospholipid-binding protein n=1 Tax=Microbacterium TaxID=33882 RepID=UPI00051A5467|nr:MULTISPECIES: LmeA family phospholipid-binding protein [Microbacterium]